MKDSLRTKDKKNGPKTEFFKIHRSRSYGTIAVRTARTVQKYEQYELKLSIDPPTTLPASYATNVEPSRVSSSILNMFWRVIIKKRERRPPSLAEMKRMARI
ncbi:hypothetical protein M5K25_011680 [Dendrobium thyrsiflorum]|uniref:Uncharacterized protein n=1 Tax=Dendrobium thyrsiflorum TaxID=117978 RepID=A0ABD0V3D6_DENTH